MQTTDRPTEPLPGSAEPGSTPGWTMPARTDPRWPFAALLLLYALAGCTVLGFNRNPFQVCLIVLVACGLDVALAYVLKREKVVPLSAAISGLSLALLLNYAHVYALLLIPVALTIGSKYVFTFKGRHIYNPSLFGVATCLLVANEWITAAPAYQWGGTWAVSIFILMAALSLFVFKVGRGPLVTSFLIFYTLQTALRAYIMRHHLPPETLFLGTLTSAPFFLFTFYMITDPATSPKSPKAQVALAFGISLVDLYLHKFESVFTFFYAAFTIASGKLVFLHVREAWRVGPVAYLRAALTPAWLRQTALVSLLILALVGTTAAGLMPRQATSPPAFTLKPILEAQSGLHSQMADAFNQVDPRLRHIAKWILSVGDAVAVGDYDNDGLPDLFLTNPLKRPEDRNALYRNLGGFRFARVDVPVLAYKDAHPARQGLAGAAVFADYDNDGDRDIFLAYGFGHSRLVRNMRVETGKATFEDATTAAGIDAYTISLTANFFDYDRDGKLDLLVGNALDPQLKDYDRPTRLNVFDLPRPAFAGDRRMFKFMHNGWHNADNGGVNVLYRNLGGGRFARQDVQSMGLGQTHWTLAIGTGDLNHDGFTDLYLATDFGPDDLFLNRGGHGYERVEGPLFGDVGKDTYKGMNSTLADFDRNGYLDIYVSNVHHALQAEGSLLWMTRPGADAFHPSFLDEATRRGILNENRFGWGAMAGDLDLDGWSDVIQTNGMVDDRLDHLYTGNKDFWYFNHKLMQSGPELHTYADMWGDIRGREIYPNEARRVYLNQGDRDPGQFLDVASVVGAADPDNSRGVTMADLDNDGDLDVVITNQHGPVSLYQNTAIEDGKGQRSWLGLELVGNGATTSSDAVGSRVEVSYEHAGKRVTQMQEVQLVNGMASQKDPRIHLGLGLLQTGQKLDVSVKWLGATAPQIYQGLAPNRYHRLAQPR